MLKIEPNIAKNIFKSLSKNFLKYFNNQTSCLFSLCSISYVAHIFLSACKRLYNEMARQPQKGNREIS